MVIVLICFAVIDFAWLIMVLNGLGGLVVLNGLVCLGGFLFVVV